MARSKKKLKKARLVVDKLEILEKSQDTKHSDTPIRHPVPQLSSEHTVGEVKFRALMEDGKDIKVTGRSRIH